MPQTKERRRELYRQNRDEILAHQRQYWRDHPEKAKEYNRRSYWGNAKARRAARREHYQANREYELQRNREYHEKNYGVIQEQRQGYYKANRAEILDAVTRRHEKNRGSLWYVKQRLLTGAKYRAKQRGIPFNLTPDDIDIPKVCPILGVPFDLVSQGNGPREFAPSIDRFIPRLGYTKGNIYVISHKANRMKGNATLKELEKLVRWMRKNSATS